MSIVGMDCGKTASDWICQYLGMDYLTVVVSTEGMTKRTISDNDNPWINPPFKDDQVSQTAFHKLSIILNCDACDHILGDEFHYLFECPSLSNERKKYFEPHFINRPNILKFCNLMNSKSVSVLCNMCKYIRICPPG